MSESSSSSKVKVWTKWGIVVKVNRPSHSGIAPEFLVGKTVVRVSEDFYRPIDVVNLWGGPTKAKAKLGWNPARTSFEELVKLMMEHDIAKVASEGAAAADRNDYLETHISQLKEIIFNTFEIPIEADDYEYVGVSVYGTAVEDVCATFFFRNKETKGVVKYFEFSVAM